MQCKAGGNRCLMFRQTKKSHLYFNCFCLRFNTCTYILVEVDGRIYGFVISPVQDWQASKVLAKIGFRVKADDDQLHVEIDLKAPRVYVNGTYKGVGQYNALKIDAYGEFNTTMSEFFSTFAENCLNIRL